MTERALIFAAIIVGLAVADQLISLHRLLKRRREVTWDPLLLWVAGLVMINLVQVWWSVAGARSVPLTIGDFLPMLVGLVFLFLLAAASLPDESDPDAIDLRQYYDKHQRYLYSLYALAGVTLLVTRLVASEAVQVKFYSLENLIDAVALVLISSMILIRNRWWQALILAILTYAGPVRWLSITLQ